MTFATGVKLGRYEIRSKLGEGGMDEVYLARDTQLDRSTHARAQTITNFTENGIGPFAFSRDGKTLAFARGTTRSDDVMIRDFR